MCDQVNGEVSFVCVITKEGANVCVYYTINFDGSVYKVYGLVLCV